MKKQGFTLIEILGSIVILGLIAAIVYPTVNNVIRKSKEKAYETQKAEIIKAAKSYIIDNPELLPSGTCSNNVFSNTTPLKLTVSKLSTSGYIENDIVQNPKDTKKSMPGGVSITYSCKYKQYEYTYDETIS